ncbi:hypothetical protein CSOJ01_00458 [Colletotrichum sojae]|uniref:Uncharacterized protein n=1 Tax=Colletotrichum sojae TaxID=2175907 RepID=A0A8H6JXU9_9PEZI|nr:hypothetical protein CSOJ01_00458 [Colletotrichum sojae]
MAPGHRRTAPPAGRVVVHAPFHLHELYARPQKEGSAICGPTCGPPTPLSVASSRTGQVQGTLESFQTRRQSTPALDRRNRHIDTAANQGGQQRKRGHWCSVPKDQDTRWLPAAIKFTRRLTK